MWPAARNSGEAITVCSPHTKRSALEPLIAGRINTALIRAHWPILRVAASIHTGTVAASLILRQLAS
jgi:TnpA family transposase